MDALQCKRRASGVYPSFLRLISVAHLWVVGYKRTKVLAAALLIALLALAAVTAGCHSVSAGKTVRLHELEPLPAPAGPTNALRIAVSGVLSPQATIQVYQDLVDYMADRLGRPVLMLQRPTYLEVNNLIATGQADVGIVCGGAYVEGHRSAGMMLLVAPEIAGQRVYYSYLIVPASSGARSLMDLKGKRFAFTDPLSNSGYLAPAYALYLMGATPERFFSQYTFTYSHDRSIGAVAEGVVDGAAVDSLVYDALGVDNPSMVARTRLIERMGPFGIPPVVVSPALDPALRSRVRDLLLTMHTDPKGNSVLRRLKVDRFVPIDDAAYDSIRQMAEKVRWSR
jgi:phosphonate transport system substrate-binding protein